MAASNMHNLITLIKRLVNEDSPALYTTFTACNSGHLPCNYVLEQQASTDQCRLEAATSRLEDIASTPTDSGNVPNGVPSITGATIVPGSSDHPENSVSTPKQVAAPLPPAIEGFDALINGDVQSFVNMSESLGGLVAEQVYTAVVYGQCRMTSDVDTIVCFRTTCLCCRTQISDRYN